MRVLAAAVDFVSVRIEISELGGVGIETGTGCNVFRSCDVVKGNGAEGIAVTILTGGEHTVAEVAPVTNPEMAVMGKRCGHRAGERPRNQRESTLQAGGVHEAVMAALRVAA